MVIHLVHAAVAVAAVFDARPLDNATRDAQQIILAIQQAVAIGPVELARGQRHRHGKSTLGGGE